VPFAEGLFVFFLYLCMVFTFLFLIMGMTHLQYIISFRSLCVALLLVSGIAKARAADGSYDRCTNLR
jgi:hypothetical protein